RTAAIMSDDKGNVKIHATVDGHSLSITEGSIRHHLKLDDQDGLHSLLTSEIFAQLAFTGYATDSDKLTFQKGAFSPQWRFLIHIILHCLSPKKTAWEQFSSNIAAAIICLATNRSHEKASTETELFIQEITPTEVIHEHEGSGAKNCLTYSIGSAEKRKDKGKGIMTDEEPKKKSKKELEQERLSYAEALRLEEQMNEEQRAQIARDAEIARQWEEEEKKKAMDEAQTTKEIDWNDPSVLRYHSLKMKPKSIAQARRNMIKYLKNQGNFKINDFKGMSYNEIRPIFEKLWDYNQKFVPMDADKGSKKQKSPDKERSTEKIVEEEAGTQEERKEAVNEPAAKRKKSIPRKTTRKRQKLEVDTEKEELKTFLDIVPREEAPIDIESLSTKFPIVDWKTIVLTETFMYYQVFRGDGSSKNYKILSEMLEDFDRMDVEELFRLVKERYSTTAPEGFDLMLWGDLHTLFEPDENDEIWKDQHEYNLLSWRLHDFCGIHILLMNNGLAIHMLTEKKYPLSQEMLSKMLSTRLEVDHESSQAFKLLRFIRAQVQK
ncbi:hypothetical protein Tco_0519870, partial [Tanacetum coccineum]